MSFGFSVGDIVLATKLTIQLYQTVANSFTTASTEIKELSDSLYSLRCALDHLGNHAESLAKALGNTTSPTTGTGTSDRIDTTEGLNYMIQSCLSTLKELDTMTKKYREAAGVVEPHSGGQSSVALDPGVAKIQQTRQPGIREKIRINWLKIRWELGKNSVDGYRMRLDSHTSSITIMLLTFQSQITLQINEDNKQWQDKILLLQIPHLQEGLRYIFRPFPEATRRQSNSNCQIRVQGMSRWMREFDFFIASSKVVGNGNGEKGLDPSLENGMIDLLSELNDTLEICEDGIKSTFYRSFKEVEFEKTVDKLLGVFRSVRGRGAVEEFLDVMEEWEGRNAG